MSAGGVTASSSLKQPSCLFVYVRRIERVFFFFFFKRERKISHHRRKMHLLSFKASTVTAFRFCIQRSHFLILCLDPQTTGTDYFPSSSLQLWMSHKASPFREFSTPPKKLNGLDAFSAPNIHPELTEKTSEVPLDPSFYTAYESTRTTSSTNKTPPGFCWDPFVGYMLLHLKM